MRLTNAEGVLEFSFKDTLDAPMPEGYLPWFEFARLHKPIKYFWTLGCSRG